ncbi:hypothetical protein ACB035_03080 [Aeromonas sp. S12(2024)]|uniref:hypothetical protein n=1 Tax=Aeromonas sp. S12(2024) TaxID=3242885 RepID=UPI0035279C8A
MKNRGRFQAQGMRLEKSKPWARNGDLGVTESIDLLNHLEASLPQNEILIREVEFSKARSYVQGANGVQAQVSKTFRVKNTKSERVDIEVRAGRAFVKDCEVQP